MAEKMRVRSSPPKGQASARPLTLEEKRERQRRQRERARREAEMRQRRLEARREARRRLFRLCLVLSLVFVLLYWSFVGVSLFRRESKDDHLPLLIFTDGNRDADKKYEASDLLRGGVPYLPVTFLEQYMAISQFGDYRTRSFLLCDGGEYATFYLGSEEAVVNGVRVSLQHKALLVDGELYLPVSFFAEKMNCFTLTESVAAYGADVLTYYKDQETFRFHDTPPSPSLSYGSLPAPPAA